MQVCYLANFCHLQLQLVDIYILAHTTQDNGTKIDGPLTDSQSEKISWRLEMNNKYPVAPLKASTGTHDDRIHPFFPKPDSNVSGYFTISQHYDWDFQFLQSADRK